MHSTSAHLQYMYEAKFLDKVFAMHKSRRKNARGGTLGIFGRGCAAGTLEPFAYTRAS